jgi:phosphoribosylanthranilate isomerase
MFVKVCGLKHADNVQAVVEAGANAVGFIFYPRSPRFAGSTALIKAITQTLPLDVWKVGVFVDEPLNKLLSVAVSAGLDTVQLHGNETTNFASELKDQGFRVLKVISSDTLTQAELDRWPSSADFLLYDTSTPQKGGSGQKFNWQVLENLNHPLPWLLSGGIGPDDAESVLALHIPNFFGLDVNSKFEVAPGSKDVNQLKNFITHVKYN